MPVPQTGSAELATRWQAIARAYRADEGEAVAALVARVALTARQRTRIAERALELAREVRRHAGESFGAEAFLRRFSLSTREGIVLMCLAEALLRIPDAETADALIKDKLGSGDWEKHLGTSESLFVNASTWALMLTGRIVRFGGDETRDLGGVLRRLVAKSGEPVIRQAVMQAMRILGRQFV